MCVGRKYISPNVLLLGVLFVAALGVYSYRLYHSYAFYDVAQRARGSFVSSSVGGIVSSWQTTYEVVVRFETAAGRADYVTYHSTDASYSYPGLCENNAYNVLYDPAGEYEPRVMRDGEHGNPIWQIELFRSYLLGAWLFLSGVFFALGLYQAAAKVSAGLFSRELCEHRMASLLRNAHYVKEKVPHVGGF